MPSYLDLGLIVVMLISACSPWCAASRARCWRSPPGARRRVAAVYLHPLVLPYAKPYISKDIVALGVVGRRRLLRHADRRLAHHGQISDAILDSRVGALDRSLGFLFGAARGLLLVRHRLHLLQLAGSREASRTGSGTPRMRPLLQATGDWLMAMLPDDPEGILAKLKTAEAAAASEEAAPDSDVEPKYRAAAPPTARTPARSA